MKHRLFVAVDLPAEVKSRIEVLQQQLDRLRLPIKWEPESKIHLTLAFLGRLADADVAWVCRQVERVAGDMVVGYLRPVALETLYQRHEPSLIYLLLADRDGRVGKLQAQLAKTLDEITPQPRRKFFPHVTIGRARKSDPTSVKQALDKLEVVEISPLQEFVVDQIHIYESFLSKSGSSYAKLATFNLGKSA